MKDWKKNIMFILELITLALSVVAIIVSVISYKSSKDANDLAEKALRSSEKQFVLANRPLVTLNSEKYEDGSYYKIEQKGRSVFFEFRIVARNAGTAVAKNVQIPNMDKAKVSGEAPFVLKDFIYEKIDASLAPGEDIYYQTNMELEKDTEEEAREYYEIVKSEGWEGLSHGFALVYENEVDPSQKYMTHVLFQILNKRVEVKKSQIIHLNKMGQ